MNKGADFESYVHYVYDTILNLRGELVQVSRNTTFRGREGESYEIDIYYEFVRAGVRHRVAVECKDWKKPVDQGQVLLFHQKIKNVGDELVGAFVSRNGYQSGAIGVAKRHGILLLDDDDLPTLPQLLAGKITTMLMPEEGCIGEPFWYIAELSEQKELTGNYYAFADDYPVKIPLFVSKKHAEQFRDALPNKEQLQVFGMPQYKLRGFLASALLRNMPIGIVVDRPGCKGELLLHPTDAVSINEDFLLDPIDHPPLTQKAGETDNLAQRIAKRFRRW